jgi:hypothetical protein
MITLVGRIDGYFLGYYGRQILGVASVHQLAQVFPALINEKRER